MPHVERDGVKIFYESFGQGTPVVFLHPLSLNRYAWVHQVFAFARTHRVVIVDHRGHGLSDKPAGGFSIREMARDARAVLDHAEIDKAILVGTSAGSMVAVQTALDAPERVLAMMLVSCATRLAPRSWRGAPSVRRAIRGCLRLHDSGIHLGDNQAREARSCRVPLRCLPSEGNFSREVFLSCIRDPDGVFNWDVTERLKDISQPALVIAGQEDQTMPMEAMRALASRLPQAEFKIVSDVGHYYQLERPGDFNADLRALLTQLQA